MRFFHQLTSSRNFKKYIIILFFLVSGVSWFASRLYSNYYVSTDNAYINANIVKISPRVTGKIVNLYVDNNQYVKKGQWLLDIDPEPFQTAIDSAKAQVEISEAHLNQATSAGKRTLELVKTKYASKQEGDNTEASMKVAQAQLENAKANLAQAQLNLQYTRVAAPISGWVTNVNVQTGDVVLANQPLFIVISDEKFWTDANFKETEMSAIKPGQPAIIVTDLYPGFKFKGIVESISGGSGSAFSLLPPQNATGNWVKVTQRIPVRIRILNPDPKHQLRIGISAKVTIELKKTMPIASK